MDFLGALPWWAFAIVGAVAAGATNVLIKAGMKGVDSYVATGVRSILIVPVVWLIAWWLAKPGQIAALTVWTQRNWVFLALSAVAAGILWVCSYKAIDMVGAALPAPIDKSSLAFTIILAVIFLGERPNWQNIVATVLVLAALGVTLIPSAPAQAQTGAANQTAVVAAGPATNAASAATGTPAAPSPK